MLVVGIEPTRQKTTVLKAVASANYAILASKTPSEGLEPPVPRHHLFSRQAPYQLGYDGILVGEVGFEPTVFTARVADLQSADFAS